MGLRKGSPRSRLLLTWSIALALVNFVAGQTTVGPQQVVAANRPQLVRSNTSSDLNESADSSGHPSITSVHQVWTSTSSGRLDELSPEMIGKLRNDVPFLAAYALRPRLVGAITSQPSGAIQPLESYISSQIQQPPSPETVGPSQRQDLIAKLGDFSELNLETSSLSKSEHHHKRKTSLKRRKTPNDGSANQELKLKRRVLETTSKLVKGTKGGSRNSKTSRVRTITRAGRLRRKLDRRNLQHHMNIIKHGRYQQPAEDSNQDDGVKGGGKKKTPFYSRSNDKRTSRDEENSLPSEDAESRNNQGDDEADVSRIEGDEELEQPEPKRVGDGDVDEVEGDTVTVMPKFDGVDDDPELPESLPDDDAPTGEAGTTNDDSNSFDAEARGKRVNRERPNEGEGGGGQVLGGGIGATTGGGQSSPGAGPSTASGDSDDAAGGSSSGGKVPDNIKPGVEFAKDDEDGDNENPSRGSSQAGIGEAGSSNEDADDAGGRGGAASGGKSQEPIDIERKKSSGEAASSDEANDAGRRETKSGASNPKKDDDDLDYRDENDGDGDSIKDGTSKRRKTSDGGEMKVEIGGSRSHRKDCDDDGSYSHHDDHHHHHDHHHNSIKWLEDAVAGKPGYDYPILSRANATNFNCRDQKYPGYYADVEARCQVFHICQADGRQDSFLLASGLSISQVSASSTNKHNDVHYHYAPDAPKYYDLNALLYKTAPQSVMSDDGEVVMSDLKPRDLPPELRGRKEGNEQGADEDEESSIDGLIKAMKRRNQNGGGGDGTEFMRMVPDGGKRIGTGADEGGANDSAQPKVKPSAAVDMIEPNDDEASTIQRKTPASAIEAADDQEEGAINSTKRGVSSRLQRRSKGKAEPRKRRRRASTRQSPPKLTSRRYSRVSRRWKLRHTPKPKRRA